MNCIKSIIIRTPVDCWQYPHIRELLDMFGDIKELPDGTIMRRYTDWFETDEEDNVTYCVEMYDVLFWQRFLSRSRLP